MFPSIPMIPYQHPISRPYAAPAGVVAEAQGTASNTTTLLLAAGVIGAIWLASSFMSHQQPSYAY